MAKRLLAAASDRCQQERVGGGMDAANAAILGEGYACAGAAAATYEHRARSASIV